MVTKHRADLPMLCSCFPLAIYFTFGSVYMSMPLSHFVTSHPSPSPYPQVHSLVGLCLYSRLAPGSSWPFFFFFLRFHMYVLPYASLAFYTTALSMNSSLDSTSERKIKRRKENSLRRNKKALRFLRKWSVYVCVHESCSIPEIRATHLQSFNDIS